MSQIRWLSDLALFDFDIKYRVGKSNQAADALSWWPANPDSASESSDGEEEWEAISYEMVCQILDYHLNSSKIPYQIKHEVQVSTADISEANSSIGIKSSNVVDVQLNQVKLSTQYLHPRWQSCRRDAINYLSFTNMLPITISQNCQ